MNWVHIVVRSQPSLFRPLKRIASLVPVDGACWRITERDYCLIFRLIVQGVYRDPIGFLHLPVRLREVEQIADVRFRVSVLPNRNRILLGWWRRGPLAARQLTCGNAECREYC